MKWWLLVFMFTFILLGCVHFSVDNVIKPPPNADICYDTLDVSWSETVQPIINLNCVDGCHNPIIYSGYIDLSSYSSVVIFAAEGSLLNSILQNGLNAPMPYEAAKLDECDIAKIRNWVEAGFLEN